MIRTENECVNCGLPCRGEACPNTKVTRVYCDECGDEGRIYHFEGQHLCINCIEEMLTEVEA